MSTIIADFRIAWTSVRRDPAHSVVVVAVLALGLAVTIAVYSIVAGVVLRPLPYADAEELVHIRQVDPAKGSVSTGASGPSFEDWRAQARTVDGLAAYTNPGFDIIGSGATAERVARASASGGFFGTLGIVPFRGRLISEADARAAEPVVVLGYGLWMRRFGGATEALERSISIGGVSHRVIGVAPPGFEFPGEAELWTVILADAGYMQVRGAHILGVLARLRPGATLASATAELDRILEAVPGYAFRTRVLRLKDEVVGELRTPMLLLLGAVLLVLLIAAANAGNLMLARADARRRELAIRAALGAGWRRVAMQVLAEGVILSALAGVAGVAVAAWLIDSLIALAPVDLPRASEVRLDGRIVGVAVAVALVTGLLTGIIPALRALRTAPGVDLRERALRGSAAGTRRTAGAFVVAEVALSAVLLVGAGLLIRSLLGVLAVDPGFRAGQLTTFEYSLPASRYAEPDQVRHFNRALLERVRALPLTRSAAITQNLPAARVTMTSPALVQGRDLPDAVPVQIAQVSDDYFRTLGIRLVAGRAFTAADRADAPPVAIVDEAFARAYFGGDDPLGQRARTYFGEEMREIVGVVASTMHASLTDAAPPRFYYPEPQMPASAGRLVVRSSAATTAVIGAVREAARAVDPGVPLGDIATMTELLARTTADRRFYATVLAAFAGLALLLAVAGFFAVLSRAVTMRRREIGIRIAVGARPATVLRLVVRDALRLAAFGVALGLAGAVAAARLLQGLLFQVRPADPAIFAGVVLVLTGTAALAAWLPARRAAATDPLEALRSE